MINKKNIKVEFLEQCYQPVIWDTIDSITNSNLTDPTVGYYAYKLQMILLHNDSYEMNNALKDQSVLINKMLELVIYPMENLTITYERDELNNALEILKRLQSDKEVKKKQIKKMGKDKFKEWEEKIIETSKTPIILHQFELRFGIIKNGVTHPTMIIRNGYLLKCLKDAGIKEFKELDNYNAVLIFNNANVNGHFCSFVKFKKK